MAKKAKKSKKAKKVVFRTGPRKEKSGQHMFRVNYDTRGGDHENAHAIGTTQGEALASVDAADPQFKEATSITLVAKHVLGAAGGKVPKGKKVKAAKKGKKKGAAKHGVPQKEEL